MRIKFLSWQCHIHLSKNHLDAFRDSSCYLYIKHVHQFFVLFLSSENAWHCISWLSKPPTEGRLWDWALLCYRNLSVWQEGKKNIFICSCKNARTISYHWSRTFRLWQFSLILHWAVIKSFVFRLVFVCITFVADLHTLIFQAVLFSLLGYSTKTFLKTIINFPHCFRL